MDFSEALVHLKNGEYIRRKGWKSNKNFHYKLENEGFITGSSHPIKISTSEILADDWEIYDPYLKSGTLIRLEDGIVGIILEFNKYTKEYTVLNENECVETYHESEVSRIEGEDFELFVDTTQAYYDGLIRNLRDCSNELEENK